MEIEPPRPPPINGSTFIPRSHRTWQGDLCSFHREQRLPNFQKWKVDDVVSAGADAVIVVAADVDCGHDVVEYRAVRCVFAAGETLYHEAFVDGVDVAVHWKAVVVAAVGGRFDVVDVPSPHVCVAHSADAPFRLWCLRISFAAGRGCAEFVVEHAKKPLRSLPDPV